MKRRLVLSIVVLIPGLFTASGAASHPYKGIPEETPLAFIEHKTYDRRSIYTNIPKQCFSRGRLTCIQLHPVFKGPGTIRRPDR